MLGMRGDITTLPNMPSFIRFYTVINSTLDTCITLTDHMFRP